VNSRSPAVGWAIVGTGKVAEDRIAPAIAALDNSTLAAVVSRDAGRAAEFAGRHGGGTGYDDYQRMLADPAVRAVYIATPNDQHADQVRAAARAGKHVLCDKPLAVDVTGAEQAVAACRQAGVRLGVTFQTRFHQGMSSVRELIAAEGIGSVITGHLEMGGGRTLLKGWRTDPAAAGVGTMNNIGVHGYDLLRYLLGSEVREVSAMVSAEPGFDLDTTALALLRFDSGALVSVQVNQTVPHHQPDLVLYGSTGRVVLSNITRPDRDGTLSVIRGEEPETHQAVSSRHAYRDLVGEFAQAVLDGRDPRPSGVDGLVSVRVTQALAESARAGRTVGVAR
jgi:1,5-anhydro-D-fructose reductase (1,5-anhydro-D-mannitol-forming)